MTSNAAVPRTRRARSVWMIAAVAACGALALLPACSSETATSGQSTASSTSATSAGGVRAVAPVDAKTLIDQGDRVIVDVRTSAEFAAGHLAGAKLIDFQGADFADQIGALDRNTKYVIYCHSGNRSSQARELMASLGFTDVADITGGITRWTAANLPIVV